jgi:hypothetical protein
MLGVTDIATCMYYTGLDPFTKKRVYVARGLRDRKMQRALMQFFKPANWFTVREALIEAGRQDLVGNGCDCLIPAQPPKEAIVARRRQANRAVEGDHYHTVANPAKGKKPGERGLSWSSRLAIGRGERRQKSGTVGMNCGRNPSTSPGLMRARRAAVIARPAANRFRYFAFTS